MFVLMPYFIMIIIVVLCIKPKVLHILGKLYHWAKSLAHFIFQLVKIGINSGLNFLAMPKDMIKNILIMF
jgi:hypothetical protein